MSKNQNLEERLDTVETKLSEIVSILAIREKKVINKDDFAKFYNTVKFDMPIKTGCVPMCIWINSKYAEDMQNRMLYPSDIEGYWYLTGEISPVPIGFKETINNEDYYVDFRAAGDFIKSNT